MTVRFAHRNVGAGIRGDGTGYAWHQGATLPAPPPTRHERSSMSTYTAHSAGRVPVHLADLDAVGIRVLRDGEVFATFAASIPKPEQIAPGPGTEGYPGRSGTDPVGDDRLWRAVLAAGCEMLPAHIEAGLAAGDLPPKEPLVAQKVHVSEVRVRDLYQRGEDLPDLHDTDLFEVQIAG